MNQISMHCYVHLIRNSFKARCYLPDFTEGCHEMNVIGGRLFGGHIYGDHYWFSVIFFFGQ